MSKYDAHIRLGHLAPRARIVCILSGQKSMNAYIRQCVERCIDEDMKKYPGTRLYMRPNEVVYSVKEINGEVHYSPITRTIGGERCWILKSIGPFPATMGGKYALMVDLTVEAGSSGVDARNVAVDADGVVGS